MDADHIIFDQEFKRWYVGDYGLTHSDAPPRIAIIGSRKASHYGLEAIERIIDGLRGYSCTIISGMAMGVDQHALRAALERGLPCIGIPGSGLSNDTFSPATSRDLAQDIVDAGGCILSPFAPDFFATRWSFVVRNSLIIELAALIVIPECEIGSGTFGTAIKAIEMDTRVAAVPGSINSLLSSGTNELLVRNCHCIRHGEDIAELLELKRKSPDSASTKTHNQHMHNEYEFAEYLHRRLLNDAPAPPPSLTSIMESENANPVTIERALCILIAERKIRIQNGLVLPVL